MSQRLRRILPLAVLLGACTSDIDLASDGELENDRDVPLDEPLDFGEPEESEEPTPADEPELVEIDAPTGARTLVASLRVLHWNIAGGKVNDCRAPEITAAVRKIIKDHDIQFVGLNEVCAAQYDAIRAALRQVWNKQASDKFSAYVGDGAGRIVGNAIFSKRDLDQVTRRELGRDQYGERNLLCGRVAAQPHLRFCSTHLTPGDTRARTQLGRVHDQLEQWSNDRHDTVILAGDLNLRPDDPAFNAVYARHANHPRNNPNNHGNYHELDDNDQAHCRGYGERSVPNTTGGPCDEGGRIDLIFVRRNRIQDDKYGADVMNIPTTCGGACSDHRPIRGHVRARVRID